MQSNSTFQSSTVKELLISFAFDDMVKNLCWQEIFYFPENPIISTTRKNEMFIFMPENPLLQVRTVCELLRPIKTLMRSNKYRNQTGLFHHHLLWLWCCTRLSHAETIPGLNVHGSDHISVSSICMEIKKKWVSNYS